MYWFRRYSRSLLHLTLMVWVLAVVVMATQGCWVQPDHNMATPHNAEQYMEDGHALHTSGCLQTCEDTASAIKPASQTPSSDFIHWTVLWLLTAAVLMLHPPQETPSRTVLALVHPAPPRVPVRLIFVRANE